MFYNNAPPLPGGDAVAGLREAPEARTFWSTARNGLRTYSSAPSTEQMMAGAGVSGVRSAVTQVGHSNGTISKGFNTANNAMGARNLYNSVGQFGRARGGGASVGDSLGEAFPKTLGRVMGGGGETAAAGATETAALGTEAAVAGGEAAAAVGGEAVAAGGLAAAGGLEAAGAAADATVVGAPVGALLGIAGLAVGGAALLSHHKKNAHMGSGPDSNPASISMSLRAPNAFGMKPPTQSFG